MLRIAIGPGSFHRHDSNLRSTAGDNELHELCPCFAIPAPIR
jgi:hypothetical protein